MSRRASSTGQPDSGSSKDEQRRSEPRPFRAQPRIGELLAIEPQALDFSYLYTGQIPNDRTEDGIAIVTIHGPLEHHATWWWDSYESIVQRIEDAMSGEDLSRSHELRYGWREDFEPLDPSPARAVVLCIDSPGGEAAGSAYAHRKIRKLRKQYNTPIYAYANETACSAAYAIASACDEIWLPDTGTVGSIGVIATLFDRTKQNEKLGLNIELLTSGDEKADGHADRPITDDIRARMQARVDALANVFWSFVAKARGTNAKSIAALEAGVFTGQDAVSVGIADGVAGWDKFLRTVRGALKATDELDGASAPAA
jgi:signal peptide peptidase SppA